MIFNIEKLTQNLVDANYDMRAINQILKGLDNDFDEIKKIDHTVAAATIRQLNEAYMNFYKNEEPQKRQNQLLLLINLANEKFNIEPLLDKYHDYQTLRTMERDLRSGYDIAIYSSRPDEKDYDLDKIDKIKLADRHGLFKDLTEEQCFAIKETELTDDMINSLLRAKREGILLQFIKNLHYSSDPFEVLVFTYFKEKQNDYVEKIKEKNTTFKKTLVELLTDGDPNIIENFEKVKGYLDKFSVYELNELLTTKITDEQINLLDINFKNSTLLKIIQNYQKYNAALLHAFDGLKNVSISREPAYSLERLSELIETEKEEETIKYIRMELENNGAVSESDLKEIILGVNSGIDVMKYVTEPEDTQVFAYEDNEKLFIRVLLEYNKRHPEKEIDLSLIFESDEKGSNFYDTSNLEGLTDMLQLDIDITPFVEVDNDLLLTLAEKQSSLKLSNEQLMLAVKYMDLAKTEEQLDFIIELISNNYKIMDKQEIYKESANIYKEINEVASYDKFSKKIIDEKLTDENCMSLIEKLKEYQKSSGMFREICKYCIQYDRPLFISADVIEKLSGEKLDIIYKDLVDGLDPSKYASADYSKEQMQILSKINHAMVNISGYQRSSANDVLRKILTPDTSVEVLEYLLELIKKEKIHPLNFNKNYTLEQTKLYDAWEDVSYVFSYDLYKESKDLDTFICDYIRKARRNLDKSLPLSKQEEIFKNAKKEALEKALELDDITIEATILIHKLQEKEEKIEERSQDKEQVR